MSEAIVKEYESLEKMMWSRAWSFHKTTNFPVDLMTIAKTAFMKARQKCNDSKYIYISVTNALRNYVRLHKPFYELPENFDEKSQTEYMRWDDLLQTLSKESREVVQIVIESGDILTRTAVSETLRSQGWSKPSIWRCMKEIKQVLKHF